MKVGDYVGDYVCLCKCFSGGVCEGSHASVLISVAVVLYADFI